MKEKKRIGEMLVDSGLLTPEQLQEALAAKKGTGLKLGQYLIRKGIINENKLVEALSRQLNIEKYQPQKYPVDPGLSKILEASSAEEYRVVPLEKSGGLLTVGMTDPTDINALDAIESLTNTEVDPVICTEQELDQLIGNIYGKYTDLGGVVERVEEDTGEEHEAAPGIDEVTVSSLQDLAEEAPVIKLANSILSQAIREKASDVHISPEKDYVQVRFRVDGKLHEVPSPPKSMFLALVSRLKLLANMDIAISRIPQDGRFTVNMDEKEINVRASTVPTIYGENLVLRLLDMTSDISTLDQLGASPSEVEKIVSAVRKPYGMILNTGPTGSGKTTTLYSILNLLNQPDIHILTLEDPVEYRLKNVRQVQLNKRAGMTFASGLRAFLRQDPDVIMVGEIRDSETATLGVHAALTGHRVLSTVHTNDAAGVLTRFLDMGIEPFLISSAMLISIAQRLVRKVCPYCKEPYQPPQEALSAWGIRDIEGANFQRGRGCFQCMDTGYRGRTGLFEVLAIDETIQNMILKGRSAKEIAEAAQREGTLRTLKEDAADKVLKGTTTLEEAASAVMT